MRDLIANPVRQVVVLMVLAGSLFFIAGIVNGVYPGGGRDTTFGYATYLFGIINLGVAFWIWQGSERGLLIRIVLAAVFIVVVIALAWAQPTTASIVIYAATWLVELVILLNALRVWRLGRSIDARDLDAIFALDAPIAPPRSESSFVRAPAASAPTGAARAVLAPGLVWLIGGLSLVLAALLVGDAVLAGFVPGGVEWGLYGPASGWLAYLHAAVLLVIALRAVHGVRLALRLLQWMSLILFVERSFGALTTDGLSLRVIELRLVGALFAVVVAIVSIAGLQAAEGGRRAREEATTDLLAS